MGYQSLKEDEDSLHSGLESEVEIEETYFKHLCNTHNSCHRVLLAAFICIPWIVSIILAATLYITSISAERCHESNQVDKGLFPQILYCELCFCNKQRRMLLGANTKIIAPAQHVLKYETNKFHEGFGWDTSIYQGPPSPELDAAWGELYQGCKWFCTQHIPS